jgi:cytochrome c553
MATRFLYASLYAALGSTLILSCAGPPVAGGEAESPPAPVAVEEPGAPTIPWSAKNPQQRKEFMGLYVLPKMKKLFQAFDSEQFAEFKCSTCHGADFEEVRFKMPNGLHPLPADKPIQAATEEDPKTTDFMMKQVVPTMAALLEEKPAGPDNPMGFGCFGCHEKEAPGDRGHGHDHNHDHGSTPTPKAH